MNDLPRKILKDLVDRYGTSLASDPLRCEGLLRDTCGKCSREIFVLVNAVRLRVPADLLSPRHSLPLPLMKGFLTKRLEDELSFSAEAAHWAVESWAEALGLSDMQPVQNPENIPASLSPGNRKRVMENDPAVAAQREQWADDLESAGPETRLDAVTGLSHTMDTGSIPLLVGALGNDHWRVRIAAYDALAGQGDVAIPYLTEALDDTSDEIVWRAALILGSLRARETVERLILLLDRDGKVRECAVWALGETGDQRGSTALLKFLNSHDPHLSREAERSLRKIGEGR